MGSLKLISALIIFIFALATIRYVSPQSQSGTSWDYWTMKAWGVNLGNWLLLERWMDDAFFQQHAQNAEDEWTFCEQASNPRLILQNHWNTWITEDDFRLLYSVHINHVRIPVGYWAFIETDPGEPYVTVGQKAQLERILGFCQRYKMYAIIDLHGLPGSQNGEHHSGRSGPIQFYTDHNIERSLRTIQAIVDWMNGLNPKLKTRIASIQSANEPHVRSEYEMNILKNFYVNSYDIINASAFKVPMMFHDGFQGLYAFSDFLPPPANAVIDIHPYYAFPPHTDTNEIINGICNMREYVESFHLPVFFGEWSLGSGVENSEWWLKQMMDTQVSVFKNSGSGGTFWALKNTVGDSWGIHWYFAELIREGIIDSYTFSNHSNAQC